MVKVLYMLHNGHITHEFCIGSVSPTWWRSQVWAVRCPPVHTSSSRWRGGIGPACTVLLGHNLVQIQHRSCVALLLPGQTAVPGHMKRLETGVRSHIEISRDISGLVTQTNTHTRLQKQHSLRWSRSCNLANARPRHKHSA